MVGAKAEDMPSDGNAVDAGRDTTDGGPLIESSAGGGSAGFSPGSGSGQSSSLSAATIPGMSSGRGMTGQATRCVLRGAPTSTSKARG